MTKTTAAMPIKPFSVEDVLKQLQQGHGLDLSRYQYGSAKHIGDYAVRQKVNHRKFVLDALMDWSDREAVGIGAKIYGCTSRTPCNSPYCPMCRHRQQQILADDIQKAFGAVDDQQLFFMTILVSVHYDPTELTPDRVRAAKKAFRNRIAVKSQTDDRYKGVRWIGAFEIDAKYGSEVLSVNQQNALTPLGFVEGEGRPFYLFHFHAVVDLAGIDAKEFRAALTERLYPHPYQIKLQGLRSDKSKADNLRDLATYMLKFRLQHSDNVRASDDQQADEFKRTQYLSLYRPDITRTVVKAVHCMGRFQGMTFKSVG